MVRLLLTHVDKKLWGSTDMVMLYLSCQGSVLYWRSDHLGLQMVGEWPWADGAGTAFLNGCPTNRISKGRDLHNLITIGPFGDSCPWDILLGCDRSIILLVLTDFNVRGCTNNHCIALIPVASEILWGIIWKQLEQYIEHEMLWNKQDSGRGMGQGTKLLT